MYINDYEFGKANFESVKKVAQYFNRVGANTPSSTADMDVSGAFMMSLVNKGLAQIVGKKEVFACIDEVRGLYRRYTANLYVLTITASDFWSRYVHRVEQECQYKKRDAENYVSAAKQKLTEVENLLAKVNVVRI